MGTEYILVNETKKEFISFAHLNGSKKRELVGGAAQSAMVTWYLLANQGDNIQFVSDTYDDWPFASENKAIVWSYPDKTNEILASLIAEGILEDIGMLYEDTDEPESVFIRNIINVWCK